MKKIRIIAAILLAGFIILPAAGMAGREKLPNDVVWVKRSTTYKCCVQQAYLNGMNRLRDLVKDKKPGTWCVVLDADETIISNVTYQMTGLPFSQKRWSEWCKKSTATALPGAEEFCGLAREMGGKVIIVTNRKGYLQEATEKNLKNIGFPYDIVLTRDGAYAKDRSKEGRREAIRKGTIATLPAGVKLPPLEIVMLAGDQTHDLYDSHKLNFEDVKDRFAKDFIIIPNPMYGSAWANPPMYPDQDAVRGASAAPRKSTAESKPARFDGKKVRVTGKVGTYRDAVQLTIGDPEDIVIIE